MRRMNYIELIVFKDLKYKPIYEVIEQNKKQITFNQTLIIYLIRLMKLYNYYLLQLINK